MSTLEDAAEALVVKLKGLDSEIEESEHRLEELRGQVDATSHEVGQEWSALTEALSSFLERVREEHQRLDQETQQALHAAADAEQAVASQGAEARAEMASGRARLSALSQHATVLHPTIAALAAGAGESPAQSLAERAGQIEQELAEAVEGACSFLRNEVVHGIEETAQDVRDRCQALRRTLAEERTAALQATFDGWESRIDALEEYVSMQGFQAAHQHAHDVVEYALDECHTGHQEQLDALRQLMDDLEVELGALASETSRSADLVVSQIGTELAGSLEATRDAASRALSSLGAVRDLLASYSFVEV